MTITQTITPLPAAPNPGADTPAEFSIKAAAFVAAQQLLPAEFNTWCTQANALEANVNAKETATNNDAIATAADRLQTGLDRAQTGLDRVQTGQDRAAAAASAATVGATAAFSDANPMVKNAADATKKGKFKADLIASGATREYQLPNKDGRIALTDDAALVLLASVTPVDRTLTIDLLNVFTPAFDNYLIIVRTLEGSLPQGEYIGLRFAVDGIVDVGSKYSFSASTGSAMSGVSTSGRVLANLYNVAQFGEIKIYNANGTNTMKGWSSSAWVNDIYNSLNHSPAGFYAGAAPISGFRLFVSGTFSKFLAKGSIDVYGYKKVM